MPRAAAKIAVLERAVRRCYYHFTYDKSEHESYAERAGARFYL